MVVRCARGVGSKENSQFTHRLGIVHNSSFVHTTNATPFIHSRKLGSSISIKSCSSWIRPPIVSSARAAGHWIGTAGILRLIDLAAPAKVNELRNIVLVNKAVRTPHVTMGIPTLMEFLQCIIQVTDVVCRCRERVYDT